MAIYRSDQAQFTFAAEATDGAMPEELRIDTTVDGSTIRAEYPAKAGAQEVWVTTVDNFVTSGALNPVNVYACFNNSNVAHMGSPEVVRVVGYTDLTGNNAGVGILYLATPLARDHAAGCSVLPASSQTSTSTTATVNRSNPPTGAISAAATDGTNVHSDSRKFITWIPGVYDTVDAPDLEEAYEERFFLADNTRRNPFMLFKGTQSFEGAVAGMVLLNGWPLRFAFGGIDTWPINASDALDVTNVGGANNLFRLSGAKGDVRAKVFRNGSTDVDIPVDTTLLLNAGADAAVTFNSTGLSKGAEIVRVTDRTDSTLTDNDWVEFNQPLQYDHGPGAADYAGVGGQAIAIVTDSEASGALSYLRHIYSETRLPSMTWNINVRDEDGVNDFQRRYYGGKLGAMTITAEEGGLVLCDWDSVQFLGMVHNQYVNARHIAGVQADAGHGMRRYHPMMNIGKGDLGIPNAGSDDITPVGLPATQPYYFSEGEIKFFGRTVARLRSFSLSVTNALEPRYYVRDTHIDDRGPFEIKEGQRTYSMTATVGLPDSTKSDSGNDDAAYSVFKELMMSGNYSQADATTGITNTLGMAGFDIEITFKRANNNRDYIKLVIPEGGTSTDAGPLNSATGGPNKQGAFIVNAPINIDNNNPMEQNVNIMFSNMRIEIKEPRSNGGQYP